jgi:hypothetical protein
MAKRDEKVKLRFQRPRIIARQRWHDVDGMRAAPAEEKARHQSEKFSIALLHGVGLSQIAVFSKPSWQRRENDWQRRCLEDYVLQFALDS